MISLVHPSRGHITQFYGARQVDGNPHAGQDYAYSNGREIFPEVFAAADGVVLFAGDSRGLSWPNIMYLNIDFDRSDWQDSSAGNYTIIAHHDAAGNRIALTGYGHQENVWVSTGQTVKQGQRIGTVGETGFSAGKHLHFDLVFTPFDVDDAPYYGRVDPNPYFTTGTTYNLASGQSGSTTTLIEEDDMALFASIEDFKAAVVEAVEEQHVVTRRDTAKNVLQLPVPYKDPITGQDTGQTTTLGTMVGFADFQAVQTRLAASTPQQIANLVPEEFVDQVSKLLIERLSK